jgi:exosortase/archaeosortase family protein
MKRSISLIVLQLAALWPVWRWYAGRINDSPDDLLCLLALGTAAILLWRSTATVKHSTSKLWLPCVLLLVYALTFAFLPPLARGVIAMTSVACTISILRFGRSLQLWLLGLFCLGLPSIPALQFFCGYPLRVFVAAVTAPILRLGGFAVLREGACLNWDGRLIWIDAPCSGIRMIWVGMYLTFTLIAIYDLSRRRAALAIVTGIVSIVFGNIFRATALFYFEGEVIAMPAWAHDYVGALTFLLVSIFTCLAIHRLGRNSICNAPVSI